MRVQQAIIYNPRQNLLHLRIYRGLQLSIENHTYRVQTGNSSLLVPSIIILVYSPLKIIIISFTLLISIHLLLIFLYEFLKILSQMLHQPVSMGGQILFKGLHDTLQSYSQSLIIRLGHQLNINLENLIQMRL